MTVNRYLFQSPSTSQVQIGRPDPSVKQEDTSSSSSTSTQLDTSSQKSQPVNPIQTESANTVQEVAPIVSADTPLLDVYA